MLCAGQVRVGLVPQGFWALWDRRERRLHERTAFVLRGVRLPDGALRVADRGVEVDLRLQDAGTSIELTALHGGREIWTRKTPLRAIGTVRIGGAARRVDA